MGYTASRKIKKELTYKYYGDNFVKRPKYSNRSCSCLAKHLHQSILEADYCNELFLLKKAKKIIGYESQHKIEIFVNGKHITNHIVDFKVNTAPGRYEFHEVKGYPTDTWKIKRKLVEAVCPLIPYIVKTEKQKMWIKR